MNWCFAIVNGRLAEIYFDKTKHGLAMCGHCYVDKESFSKREQKMIDKDISRFLITYRNNRYYDRVHKKWFIKAETSRLNLKKEAVE